ncbi:MAG: FHA domain-containing protein [Burkholderiales bacterium]|nr:FHA domain-containing protein [Anaerolineae bacterium]
MADLNGSKILLKLSGPEISEDQLTVSSQGLRVGRSKDNDLVLDNREISRQHMRIIWREDKYYVEDLNSSNGVWLNDQRIYPREAQELTEGDNIRVGPFLMKYVRLILAAPNGLTLPLPVPVASQLVPSLNGANSDLYMPGIPRDKSSWLQYLPSIYSEDEFIGRYLLIFESVLSPIIWVIDNFDMYLSPEVAPAEWLQWMSSWFDLLMLPDLPIERQRSIVQQMGWLFLRRGTRAGLERLLELYFGVTPEIIENETEPCHFIVRLPLSQTNNDLGHEVADRLIASQKPAFASFTLEIT